VGSSAVRLAAVTLTPQTSIVLPRNCRAIDPWKSRKNWLRNIQLPLGICSFFTHLMRRAFDRPSAGVCDSHSHDLDRVVASLFAINRRHGAPGEHRLAIISAEKPWATSSALVAPLKPASVSIPSARRHWG